MTALSEGTPPARAGAHRRAANSPPAPARTLLEGTSTGLLRFLAQTVLAKADVRLDGDRPWDIRIHDVGVFSRVATQGSIGFGEAYLDGAWSCQDLEELAFRIAANRLEEIVAWHPGRFVQRLRTHLLNEQSRGRAKRVAREHYDLSNEFFGAFLGRYMSYSCGYFRDTEDLDEAQRLKLDLLCRKLALKPGEHLLDVGSGWGAFARHAATHYGVRVTSINISEDQIRFAREHCRGLNIEILKCDYRDVQGQFDKVAAVAMFTHVGHRNYRKFMKTIARVLKPQGLFVMEGIWGNVTNTNYDAWMDKYIFPGGCLPSAAQTFAAAEGIFLLEDLHNFGPDYTKTLRAWNANLRASWPRIGARYGDRLRRIFEYYFQVCAGYFRARAIQNWQLVLSRPGRLPTPFRLR